MDYTEKQEQNKAAALVKADEANSGSYSYLHGLTRSVSA